MSKTYFVVHNVVSDNDGIVVASGTIPATSPVLTTSGIETEGEYSLYKVPSEGLAPDGGSVVELTVEEARISVDSELFNGGITTTAFIGHEQEESQALRAHFMVAQAGLSIGPADALFTALEPTSHALSAGSLNISYTRFDASSVDQATKDAFNPLFERFFTKFPRDLT